MILDRRRTVTVYPPASPLDGATAYVIDTDDPSTAKVVVQDTHAFSGFTLFVQDSSAHNEGLRRRNVRNNRVYQANRKVYNG